MTYTTTTACDITDNHTTGRAILVNVGGLHLPATGYDFDDVGLFRDDESGAWYAPTAEIVAARRARATEFAGKPFFAGQNARYSAITDAMESALVAHV